MLPRAPGPGPPSAKSLALFKVFDNSFFVFLHLVKVGNNLLKQLLAATSIILFLLLMKE